jgi:hypothetical protein
MYCRGEQKMLMSKDRGTKEEWYHSIVSIWGHIDLRPFRLSGNSNRHIIG